MFRGLDTSAVTGLEPQDMNWDFIKRLRDIWPRKLVVKGSVTREDSGRAPILVDGGFRRGSDIFKALALGATAVGIGRPYIWGLASFGQEGVEKILDILRRELLIAMRQAGTRSIAGIDRSYVVDNRQ